MHSTFLTARTLAVEHIYDWTIHVRIDKSFSPECVLHIYLLLAQRSQRWRAKMRASGASIMRCLNIRRPLVFPLVYAHLFDAPLCCDRAISLIRVRLLRASRRERYMVLGIVAILFYNYLGKLTPSASQWSCAVRNKKKTLTLMMDGIDGISYLLSDLFPS